MTLVMEFSFLFFRGGVNARSERDPYRRARYELRSNAYHGGKRVQAFTRRKGENAEDSGSLAECTYSGKQNSSNILGGAHVHVRRSAKAIRLLEFCRRLYHGPTYLGFVADLDFHPRNAT
jgi:hypothetical protein